jgi:Zn-dependent protease
MPCRDMHQLTRPLTLTTSLLAAGLLSAGAAPGFPGVATPAALAIRIGTLLMAIILHEVAHGWVANRLGDPTARDQGRLTLNPLPHLDLFGSLVIPGFLLLTGSPFILGWAKPVPIDIRRFRDPLRGFAIAAVAGPVANFIQLVFFALLFRLAVAGGWPLWIVYLAFSGAAINLLLGLFNLLPIPPLDGSRIVAAWLPSHLAVRYLAIERFGFVLIFGLLWLGALGPLFDAMWRLLSLILV